MEDWRSPKRIILGYAKDAALKVLAWSGTFEPRTREDRDVIPDFSTTYLGNDRGQLQIVEKEQSRLAFRNSPPDIEIAQDVLYTSSGMAWQSDRLVERYSVRNPSLREALSRPSPGDAAFIDEAIIVESDVPYTYGDWLCVFLVSVLDKDVMRAPLLIPQFLGQKQYVLRDLREAGINFLIADKTYRIGKATVLRKRWPLHYWTKREIQSYQETFAPIRVEPSCDSITYVGRFDVHSESVRRKFPSDTIARIVDGFGGRTVRSDELSPKSALPLGGGVETLIADFGSSVLNILHWKPKNVIELIVDDWWVNVDLLIARQIGVTNFAVLNIDGLSPTEIESLLVMCLERFDVRHHQET